MHHQLWSTAFFPSYKERERGTEFTRYQRSSCHDQSISVDVYTLNFVFTMTTKRGEYSFPRLIANTVPRSECRA